MNEVDDSLQSQHIQELGRKLADLPQGHCVALAAWCCERLYPWYAALATYLRCDEHHLLRELVNQLWRFVLGQSFSKDSLHGSQKQCENLEIGKDGCSILRRGAMEAVSATWLALEACRNEPAYNAARAAECVLNRADGEIMAQVWELYDRPLSPDDMVAVEQQVYLHPTMQDELKRQTRVTALLATTPVLGTKEIEMLIDLAR